MKIVVDSRGMQYIDQDLKDYLNKIFLNFDVVIPNDKALLFSKNTTVNKLITDYNGTGIHRVIKREKAEYVVINRIYVNNYPQYFDGTNITNDDTQEVVYGIYNNSMEDRDTIDMVLDFFNRKQEVVYVNQDKLNDSLNNGFVIDRENYNTIKELIDSSHTDNHILAINMLVGSKLEDNWEWVLYLLFGKDNMLVHDKKGIIQAYFNTLGLSYRLGDYLRSLDKCLSVIKNADVKEGFEFRVRHAFNKNISNYLKSLGTEKFTLEDFKLKLND